MKISFLTKLTEVKEFLRLNYRKGCDCPACGQKVKMYERPINSTMARMLINLYKKPEIKFYHTTSLTEGINVSGGGDFAKLKHWGLIDEKKNINGAKRTSGHWMITYKGREFVELKRTVPKYVKIFNQSVYGYSEEHNNISTCLGEKFDYTELMLR